MLQSELCTAHARVSLADWSEGARCNAAASIRCYTVWLKDLLDLLSFATFHSFFPFFTKKNTLSLLVRFIRFTYRRQIQMRVVGLTLEEAVEW